MKAYKFALMVPYLFFGEAEVAAVLTSLGLPADKVTELAALPANSATFKPDEYVATVRTGLQNTLLTDPAFIQQIKPENLPPELIRTLEKGQYGKFMNEASDFITKTIGVDLADLSTDDAKSLKKVMQKAFEKYGAKINSPEALQQLQTQLQGVVAERDTLKTGSEEALTKLTEEYKNKTTSVVTRLVAETELTKIPGLKVDAEYVVDKIVEGIAESYIIVVNGTKVELMDKKTPTLHAMKDGKKIEFKELLKQIATDKGLVNKVEEKKDDIDPATGKIKVEVGAGGVVLPEYIAQKIKDNSK